jgi:hypothetical protein
MIHNKTPIPFLFREYDLYFVETGKIPTKQRSASSCFVFCEIKFSLKIECLVMAAMTVHTVSESDDNQQIFACLT